MNFQFDIGSSTKPIAPLPPLTPTEMVPELLRQILEVQREQLSQILDVQVQHLNHVRAAAQDHVARWRHILSRWQQDRPELTDICKKAYPILERAYVHMLVNAIEELAEQDDDTLENEFALQEFLDRYGMKIGQLSHILGVVGPMSEAAQQNEAARQQQEAAKQQPQG